MGESTGQQSTERHLKHKNKKLNSTDDGNEETSNEETEK